MNRRPEQCRFRAPIDPEGGEGRAFCGIIARITGAGDEAVCAVGRDACEACCRGLLPGDELNPVVASLVFGAAGAILRAGGVAGCDADRARRVRERIVGHLGVVDPGVDDRTFPPEAARGAGPARVMPGLTWAVGVTTAPRGVPFLGPTLRSLERAGFGPVHVFAEPDSWLPPDADPEHVHVNTLCLGNFANFYSALAWLYRDRPDADAIALFQDDVEAADGLRAWCDDHLWPSGTGLVSLFTPRVHGDDRPGWRLLSPGYFRVYGGQALAFRRDVLEDFLADPSILSEVRAGWRHNNDALVAAWASRRRMPIAYHTPSLVQHTGHVSSIYDVGPDRRVFADAVSSVDRIDAWRPLPRRPGKVGLVGWDDRTGLGYQNDDLARNLGVDRWLVPDRPSSWGRVGSGRSCRVDQLSSPADPRAIRDWLRGLDWVLFVERPCVPGLAEIARAAQVSIACVPNWEWLHPGLPWLPYVDLMLCPTRHTFALVSDWRRRYGFGWEVRHVPWPVDTRRFRFVERRRCEQFVFANGWGGGSPIRLDGTRAPYSRKGMDLIVEAARRAPHLPILVYSQRRDHRDLPANITLRPPPDDNRRLYRGGDVCVQPSHFEGLGLQLLECQAAGMPLVTTAAAPMDEYEPLATIPVVGTEIVRCEGDQPIASQILDAGDLVRVLDGLLGADIAEASRLARAFVEREHSWDRALPLLRDALIID